MRVRPILMSVSMAKALVDGGKNQTRRMVKPQPPAWYVLRAPRPPVDVAEWISSHRKAPVHSVRCPYGACGDLLWVRETWAPNKNSTATSQASISYKADSDGFQGLWRPSIHMPRWASRITLRVTDIQVVRLQAVSLEDIIAAGCPHTRRGEALHWFRCQWEANYAQRGYGWELNPWVWLLEFDVILENVDTMLGRNSTLGSANPSGRVAK